jgi:hypothetical protein
MPKIRRDGYVFGHVHVYRHGTFGVVMKGRLSRRVRRLIDGLVAEGRL